MRQFSSQLLSLLLSLLFFLALWTSMEQLTPTSHMSDGPTLPAPCPRSKSNGNGGVVPFKYQQCLRCRLRIYMKIIFSRAMLRISPPGWFLLHRTLTEWNSSPCLLQRDHGYGLSTPPSPPRTRSHGKISPGNMDQSSRRIYSPSSPDICAKADYNLQNNLI
jgi:hypothetical protein